MNSGFLDIVVQTYISALLAGFNALYPYSFALLGLFGAIAWGIAWIPLIGSGGITGPAAMMMHAVLLLMTFGLYHLVLSNIMGISTAIFTTFAQWGAAVAGGSFQADDFLHPSGILDMAFIAATPIRDYVLSFSGWSLLFNLHMEVLYGLIFLAIIGSFLWVAKDIITTIIEFHFAVLTAPILIPWGILSVFQELAGFSISWILGTSIRIFLTSAALGIGVPLFRNIAPSVTPGGDPTLYSGIVLGFSSFIFALLSHYIPQRAAMIAGRGMALALPGMMFTTPAGGALRYAASGVSRVIRSRGGA